MTSIKENIIRIFIGYDPAETVAYNVLQFSIIERSSQPVTITPIRLSHLKSVFNRERNPLQSTEFSFSRFLTPYLCDFEGWAVFMDNDVLVLDDITKLWALRNDDYAVQVVKHDYQPKDGVKFLNAVQTKYEKKNWSSVMLFNCKKCKALTPEYVNTASGLELHQFKWLENDNLIGDLPPEWNHLVSDESENPNASLIHFTVGGPYFEEYKNCEFSREWREERDRMLICNQREAGKISIVK